MSRREYRVYHKNSETRTVAVIVIVTTSRKKAMEDSMIYAKRWNWTETRPNMITHFLECEGLKQEVQ